ncbi:MAG: DEAD/DEAH box helicase [Nitrospirae bacterium]|nr:DEAD/DEAH box helicase [Nitrospirota bacterium]
MLYRNFTLDRFQEEAIRHMQQGASVLVAAPTGSGKTLIAQYALEQALLEGKRAVYTAPVKALSNQKFREFSALWGHRVGIVTGDVAIHPQAEIIIMTTEIFRNALLESTDLLENVGWLVMDEIHYMDDRDRGTVWEECLILAPASIRLVCLSATVSNLEDIGKWLKAVRPERPIHVVRESTRPIPLEPSVFVPSVGLMPINKVGRHMVRFGRRGKFWEGRLILDLEEMDRLPGLFFCFSRRDVEYLATSRRMPDLGAGVAHELLDEYKALCHRFGLPENMGMKVALARGTAYHHAGLLPAEKEVVERLFSTGRVRMLFATETFAMGVHMPARTVIFRTVFKMDHLLRVREFQQMSGRAGRRGLDEKGYVVLPPEAAALSRDVLAHLVDGEPEPVQSRFKLSYGTILHLYETLGDRIFEILQSSFLHYDGTHKRDVGFAEREVKQRLRLLETLGYIKGGIVTRKGEFASRLYGFEMTLSEAFHQGNLKRISGEEIAVLACSIAYEGDQDMTRFRLPPGVPFRKEFKNVWGIADDLRRLEYSLRIFPPVRLLDFGMGPALYTWMNTGDFQTAALKSERDPGDLVRVFRLTVQILRDLKEACDDSELRERMGHAISRISRGVVDPKAELLAGMEAAPIAGELAGAAPGPSRAM